MSTRILTLTGTAYPKAGIIDVNPARGIATFRWLTAGGLPVDSGGSVARFVPLTPDADGNFAAVSDATLRSAIESPPAAAVPPGAWTPLEFLERFTQAELVALFTSAHNGVLLFRVKVLAARQIRTDTPQLDAGLTILVNQGIITALRKTEILTP